MENKINATDGIVNRFLELWHERGRAGFERSYSNLDYDSPPYSKTAKQRRKYIALDEGTSGVFLLDRATGVVCGIKAYGVIHPGKLLGNIHEVVAKWLA